MRIKLRLKQDDFVLVQIVLDRRERRQGGRTRQNEAPNARVSQQLVGQFAVIKRAVVHPVDQVFFRQNDGAFAHGIHRAHAAVWAIFNPTVGGNAAHEGAGLAFKPML